MAPMAPPSPATGLSPDGLLVAVTMWGVVLPEGNDLPARALSVDDLILLQKVAAEPWVPWCQTRPEREDLRLSNG